MVRSTDRPDMTLDVYRGPKTTQQQPKFIFRVHVRRTDKVGLEAAYHGIEEYMLYVDEWFDTYEQRHPGIRRKVYLASDDPTVLSDAKKL